jgi:glycosyltransferase involved in cell wall biosynthesis
MKIAVTGLRGFPNVQGGIETHAQNLYPLLVKYGAEVTVLGRRPYLGSGVQYYQGVKIVALPCPRNSSLETVVHTFLSVLYCGFWYRPDVLHFHAVGPGLFAPLARLFGLQVVFTHHGEDYHRQKWGRFASQLLRLGERYACRYSGSVIAISKRIQDLVWKKYSIEASLIPNGVVMPALPNSDSALKGIGLRPYEYILVVGRLVPEKRQNDLLEAFSRLRKRPEFSHIKLAIVGAPDHRSEYADSLKRLAEAIGGVVMAGFQSGEPLAQLYRWAGIFCLPSSHEGLPISMLEAMSYGCPILASDIQANLEVGLTEAEYFALGDIKALEYKLAEILSANRRNDLAKRNLDLVKNKYDWDAIAKSTMALYEMVGFPSGFKSH